MGKALIDIAAAVLAAGTRAPGSGCEDWNFIRPTVDADSHAKDSVPFFEKAEEKDVPCTAQGAEEGDR